MNSRPPKASITYVTSAQVRERGLHPALEAVAENLQQQALLHRPDTPAPDSVLELLALSRRATDRAFALLSEVLSSNGRERECEQQVSGWADTLAHGLRDTELNGSERPESGRQLAQRLIEVLTVVDDPSDPIAGAVRLVDLFAIFREVPRDVLLRDAVTYVLGKQREARVRHWLGVYDKRRQGEGVRVTA